MHLVITKVARVGVVIALAAMILAVWVLRARLLDTININWDEFHFLSLVHTHLRGELTAKLLTFHVHFLGWVASTSPNEALQVLTLREVMFALALLSSACIAFVGWRLFGSAAAALFTVLAAQSTSYLMHHGASVRFDSIVSMLFSLACALLIARRPAARFASRFFSAGAGVVIALALLFSIKSVLFVPTLVALCFFPVIDRAVDHVIAEPRAALRRSLVDTAWFAGATLATFVPLYFIHVATLGRALDKTRPSPETKQTSLVELFAGQFPGEILPQAESLVATLRWDLAFWATLLAGTALAFVGIGAGGAARRLSIKVLCFALPLCAVALYRNAYPYFYVSVVPSAALLTGLVVARVEQALSATPKRALAGAMIIIVVSGVLLNQALRWYRYNSDDQTSAQIRTVDVVHHVFPEPVSYIDRCSMIASFPQAGVFMTSWVLDKYHLRKKPIMAALVERKGSQFLLTNIETLEVDRPYSGRAKRRLLKEDFVFLQQNFVPHWGPLWVAGKVVALDGATEARFTIATAARYVVELAAATNNATIDGATVKHGDVVLLSAGAHRATSASASTLTLRIANARPPPPDVAPPAGRLFTTLGFRSSPPK